MLRKRKGSLIIIALVSLLILFSVNITEANMTTAAVNVALSNTYHSNAIFYAMIGQYLETWDLDGTAYFAMARDTMWDATDYAWQAYYEVYNSGYYTYSRQYTLDDYYDKYSAYQNLNLVLQGNDLAGIDAIVDSWTADMNNGLAALFINLGY